MSAALVPTRSSRGAGPRRQGTPAVLVAAVVLLAGCSLPSASNGSPVPVTPTARMSAAPSTDPAQQPRFAAFYGQKPTWTGCDQGFECTTVKVPVDWDAPTAATLDLAVIRRKATRHRIGSLLINPGGPGVSGVSWVRQSVSGYGQALRESFDMVGWDPRGIGSSGQIKCLPNDQLDAYLSTDPTPDDAAERSELVRTSEEFAAGCRLRTGSLLAHADTLSTVKDMDVLRAVLGDRTLSYFGASYGTFLGAWYAQTFPWRVGRLVLDGAVDPSLDAKGYIEGQAMGFARAIEAYLADCLKQQRCPLRGTVDEARAQLDQLIERADAQPLPTSSGGRRLTQALLITGVVQGMYAPSLWPRLTDALTRAMQGDGTGLLELADLYYERDSSGRYGEVVQSNVPIFCLDHPENRTLDQIARDAAVLGRRYTELGEAIGWGAITCENWPIKPVLTPQRLTAQGAAPILVVGSTGDPATPYEWAKSLAGQLSSARLLTREGLGHTGYGESVCVNDAVDAYLVSGTLPPDGTVCDT
jgi:pimeloyl-ACP methyl ester carboxylesterase